MFQAFKLKNSYSYWHILVLMVWARYPIMQYVSDVFFKLPFLNFMAESIVNILFIIVILMSASYWSMHIRKKYLAIFFVFELVASAHIILYPENYDYFSQYAFDFIFYSIPVFLIGAMCDIREFEDEFYVISLFSVILQLLYFVVYGGGSSLSAYMAEDIVASYRLLPHVIMVVWQALKHVNVLNLVVSLSGSLLLVALGTRGPVVCLLAFVFLYIMFVKFIGSPKHIAPLGIIGAILFVNIQYVLNQINELILKLGLSTRIFSFLQSQNLNYESGRDDIRNALDHALAISPPFGYGLAGDRRFVGGYAHNLYYELSMSFGVFLGPLLFISVIAFFIIAFLKTKIESEKGFLLVLFCVSVLNLMFSGTFLTSTFLFFFLGFCCHVNSSKNNPDQRVDSLTPKSKKHSFLSLKI